MLLFKISRWLCLLVSLFLPCNGSLQPGFSQLQWGHRLDRKMIQSFAQLSFLDCVIECLVTPRCKSVNYFKGANFCEINYENKTTAETNYVDSAGWVYSEKAHWPRELAGACAYSNCQINETCKHKKYSKDTSYECVLSDCGIPNRTGIDLNTTHREDAIGIHRRIHASCSDGYFQFGSGRLICQSNGEWKYDIVCEEGWAQFENHIYRLFADKKSWIVAKQYCESKGAYLAEINTDKENDWIHKTLVVPHFTWNLVNQANDIFAYSVWIGGSDLQENRVFVWSRNGDDFTFTNWLHGQPHSYQNSEHCVEMIAVQGKWNDRHCDHNTPFVCEKDIQ